MITRRQILDAVWELIGEHYAAGTSLDALARRHCTSRHAMTVGLQQRGLFVEGRKNKPAQATCKRGHDLTIHGRALMKTQPDGRLVKNGRECLACKRARQRVGGIAA